MGTIFDFANLDLTRALVGCALLAAGVLLLVAVRQPHLARIGLRSVRRRRVRTLLIIFGLMLSTTFIAASLLVDDTVTLAVKSVAVYGLGRIDEDVSAGNEQPFDAAFAQPVEAALSGDPNVAGVAPALRISDLLVADETSRQVRGGVFGLGLVDADAGPLGDLRAGAAAAPPSALSSGAVYLNAGLQQYLDARPGDSIYLYSASWPGQRYGFRVQAVVTGGPLGEQPVVVVPLAVLQTMASDAGQINHIYIANAGNGLSGVARSDEISDRLFPSLPPGLEVHQVKAQGVQYSLRAEDIFARILTLYTLFVLAIGVLLIFLIFVLLAAERRAELGMVRVLGMRRGDVVRMLLLEGAIYDVLAALVGLLIGLGLGVLIVQLVSPTIARVGFPLQISVRPQSILVAYCLGLLTTLLTMWLAAWTVSRMTLAAALRDLPEPPVPGGTLLDLGRAALLTTVRAPRNPRAADAAWGALAWALVARGPIPLALGWYLLRQGAAGDDQVVYSLGISCVLLGIVLLLRALALAVVRLFVRSRLGPAGAGERAWVLARASLRSERVVALAFGVGLVLYWSLPLDGSVSLGLPRFAGGVDVLFVAGLMMVLGAVIALAPSLDLLVLPVRALLRPLGRVRHVSRLALVYPSRHRFRTGVGLAMFSLVCFTMVAMACISASVAQSYDNLPAQAAGYDVAGQPLFSPIGGLQGVSSALRAGGQQNSQDIAAESLATPLPLGMIQTGARNARWSVYPASEVQGAFLDGVGLPLVARADGFASDSAVWQAVRSRSGDVVVDEAALSAVDASALGIQNPPPPPTISQFLGPPIAAGLPGLSSLESLSNGNIAAQAPQGALAELSALANDPSRLPEFSLHLRNIVSGPGRIAPVTLWVSDLRGGPAIRLTIVGVVQNVRGERYGLLGSPATFAPAESGLPPFGNEYYYFRVRPGVDAHVEARLLGSVLLDHGFETTALGDVLLDVNGPQVFISRVLIGLVGLLLFVGMAALAIAGSRAVVERRQQIGMLRALGFQRWHVQLLFVIETVLVGAVGTAIGLVLGLVLCRNIFAVDFFEPIRSGLVFVVPGVELVVICMAAVGASLLAALLPAWQAGHVTPAAALRYE